MSEVDDITFLLHCLLLGAIEPAHVVSWADKQIAGIEQPPYWLMQLSTEVKDDPLAIQKILFEAGAAPQVDDDTFLALVAGLYSIHSDVGQAVSLLMERFCFCDWKEMTDFQREVYLMDDEFGWDESKGIGRLTKLLEKHLPVFKYKSERMGLKHG